MNVTTKVLGSIAIGLSGYRRFSEEELTAILEESVTRLTDKTKNKFDYYKNLPVGTLLEYNANTLELIQAIEWAYKELDKAVERRDKYREALVNLRRDPSNGSTKNSYIDDVLNGIE